MAALRSALLLDQELMEKWRGWLDKIFEWEVLKEWREWWREKEEDFFDFFGSQWYDTWWVWAELALIAFSVLFLLYRCVYCSCQRCSRSGWCCCCCCCSPCCCPRDEEEEEVVEVEMADDPELLAAMRREQAERRKKAAARLRSQVSGKACDFCGLAVFWREAEEHKGRCYHRDCFRCASCGRGLRGVPHGQVDDCLYCDDTSRDRGGASCLSRLKLSQSGYTAAMAVRESLNQRLRLSSVEMVSNAQKAAIKSIGDDLEDIIAGMAPKCAICGATFSAADELVMQGMVKFHKDCLEASWRGKTVREGVITPARAIASAPGTLLFKLQLPGGKVMTFFLVREPDDNKKAVSAVWLPDLAARASNRRKCSNMDLEEEGGIPLRVVGELGADIAPAEKLVWNVISGKLTAAFIWKSCGLDWDLRSVLEHDRHTGTVQALRADLKVSKAKR